MLFSTELWERFSHYGMRAVLVLYLTDLTANGGMAGPRPTPSSCTASIPVWSTSPPSSAAGSQIPSWSQRRAILFGAVLMAAGQFTLALPHAMFPDMVNTVFYAGLAC